jgi:hypothetical protein
MSSYQYPTFSAQPNVDLRPLDPLVFPQRHSRLRFKAMPSQGGAEDIFYQRIKRMERIGISLIR